MSPIFLDDDDATPTEPSVVPSLAVSMACAMCANIAVKEGRPIPQAAVACSDFWGDGGTRMTGDEVVILAHLAHVLETDDFAVLGKGLEGRIGGPRTLRLATESEAERRRIQDRVNELRSSSRRRREYVEMLREVWRDFEPSWEGPTGRRARRAVDRYAAELHAGRSWRSLAPTPKREALIDRVLSAIGREVPVVLSPALSMGSLFVLDVDDALVVGLPVPEPQGEEQAEELARQLKAVAHPTRLAIVREVARRPATVGELARTFCVAQPTMTGHLRQLREAGLVRRADDSGRSFTVDRAVAEELMAALAEIAGLDTEPVGGR